MTPILRRPRPARPLIIALGLLPGLAPTAPAQVEPQISTEMRAGLQRFIDSKEISGAVTLVGTPDGVVSLMAVGLRDSENNLPMGPDTVFRIASMTKPITAVAILMLLDEGKLAIDDPVEKYLPEFRGQMLAWLRQGDSQISRRPARPITLRDLLTHTSGLPDSSTTDSYGREDGKPSTTLAESSEIYGRRPLSFEPGTRWSYSNSGINTLGRVIEVVSGMPYEDFLKDRIFEPLGMPDTTFYPSPDQMKRAAVVYSLEDGGLSPVDSFRVAPVRGERPPSPAGGLFSTASDLSKLYQMMLRRGTLGGRRILSESAVDRMTRLQTGEIKCGFVDGMGFGLGWGFVKAPGGVTEALSPGTYGHGGAYGTQAWIDPRKGRFAILMIQCSGLANSDASPMRREFQKVAFPITPP
jgi:CubicO group peptidase (beta-lactamase class C family)